MSASFLRQLKYLLLSVTGILISTQSHAFPEMVRMGYQNCTACHVSPSGGGILTDYGRSMASEILSTWNYEGEEKIGHGLVTTPEWLHVGGDSYWVQTYVDDTTKTQKWFFPMQNDLEAAVRITRLWLVGTLGVQGGTSGVPSRGNMISHRYYALYNLSDETYVRAGKYLLPFGINQPNHTVVTKQNLAWDESQNVETYNVETGYIGEKYNASLVADFGRSTDPSYNWQNHFVPNDSTDNLERGLAANFAFNLYDTFKLGFSGFGGFNNDATRYVLGPNFILGFTKKLIFLSEYDYQLLYPHTPAPTQASEQRGFVSYNRLQYEFYKGVNGYIAHQLSYLDLTSGNTRIDMLGAGLDFFPRPHFEIQGEWNKKRTASVSDSYSDYAWLLLHYYL